MKLTVHAGTGINEPGIVYCNDHCQPDFGDIRFTTANGTELDYWMEENLSSNISNNDVYGDFQRYNGNPLDLPQYGASGTVHPDTIYFPEGKDGYKYWMVYTPYPPETLENMCIVRSNDGVNWTDTGISNPVISMGPDGDWDERHLADPDMIYVSDFDMWFMVWCGTNYSSSNRVGFAYSSDGKTWTEYDGIAVNGNMNPVLLAGHDAGGQSWEQSGSISNIGPSSLLYENGIFYIYYVRDAPNNGGPIGLASFEWDNISNDIINFSRYSSNPIIDLPDDSEFQSGSGHVDVSHYNGMYYMYTVRNADSGGSELVCLNSTDKINWTYRGKVIGKGASGTWDSNVIYRTNPVTDATGNIILFGDYTRLYYSASGSTPFRIGFGDIELNFWEEPSSDAVSYTHLTLPTN